MNKNILVLCICIYVLVCVCMISYGIIPEVRARGCGQGVSRVWHCQETTFSDVGDGNMGSWALRLQQQSHYKDGRRGYKPSEETVQHSTLLFKRAVSNSINDKTYQGACVCVLYHLWFPEGPWAVQTLASHFQTTRRAQQWRPSHYSARHNDHVSRNTWQCRQSLFLRYFRSNAKCFLSSPLILAENTTCLQASDRSIYLGIH